MAQFLPVGVHVDAGHSVDWDIAVRSFGKGGTVLEGSSSHMLVQQYWAVVVDKHLVVLACHDMQQVKRFPALGLTVVADS
jgi:hypothetical protein